MNTRRDFFKQAFAFLAASSASGAALAAGSKNPFGFTLLDKEDPVKHLAEGKCGSSPQPKDGKCGTAKCGTGKCGTGKCGASPKSKAVEGKCGAGKCGASPKPRANEGKCGSGKCGSGN